MDNNGEIIIYQADDGLTHIEVKMEDETVWLTQAQLVQLYQTSKSNVSEHIKHIFEEGELEEKAVVRKFRTTAADGKSYNTTYYNLDMIISLGYRIKSSIATNFRRWATARLKEYMIKGFTMDDERLKQLGGGNYWKELLDRIRDIRSSEKVLYRQVLDLYATSVDYDPNSAESVRFFKIVQNKLHYAAHGHTAAEVIYQRADASKPFMGLKTFRGEMPVLSDVKVAKNYLDENELKILNNLVWGCSAAHCAAPCGCRRFFGWTHTHLNAIFFTFPFCLGRSSVFHTRQPLYRIALSNTMITNFSNGNPS